MAKQHKVAGTIQALVAPFLLAAAWEVLSRIGVLSAVFFPPPSQLASKIVSLCQTGELPRQAMATFLRLTFSSALGIACGLAIGVGMGAVTLVRRSLEPLVSGLFAVPKITLLPLLMLLIGVGDGARIIMIALGGFVVMALHSMDAVRGINPAYVELASNYGVKRWQLIRKVYLPAALPQIFTGLRLSVATCLVLTVTVEIVNCPDGLGNMIWMSWQTFSIEKLYAGIILASALGIVLHKSLRSLERTVIRWKQC